MEKPKRNAKPWLGLHDHIPAAIYDLVPLPAGTFVYDRNLRTYMVPVYDPDPDPPIRVRYI